MLHRLSYVIGDTLGFNTDFLAILVRLMKFVALKSWWMAFVEVSITSSMSKGAPVL